jgi:hypothetical protein
MSSASGIDASLGPAPIYPGSPYAPIHTPGRRVAYFACSLLLGALVNLGNALIIANEPILAGARGDDLPSTAILPGVYVAFNAAANLVLVKSRAQFGIPRVTRVLLIACIMAALVVAFIPSVPATILLSAITGTAGAGMTTLSVYFAMQSLPEKLKPAGLVIGVGAVQFGTPLARLVPVDVLALGGWQSLALIQVAVALVGLVVIHACPLPPTVKQKVFGPLDLLTYVIMVLANVALCVPLAGGRLLWWHDTPWLGWALASAVPLYAILIAIEANRRNPLLQLQWYGTSTVLRFAAVALIMRLALSEQSFGAVGLLAAAGLNNDQFGTLFSCIWIAQIVGIVVAVVSASERRLPYQVLCAALLIAFASWLDSGIDALTRPSNVILSQSLIAFATTLFIGPTLLYGAAEMQRRGGGYLISLVVLFSITQNIGGLAGSALLGTFQVVRAKVHAAALADGMIVGDPAVSERISAGAGSLSSAVSDPSELGAQGAGLLGQALSRQAAVLGFIDAFTLVELVALAAAVVIAVALIRKMLRERQSARTGDLK